MQKIGFSEKNEGWLYICLPQSIYLTSPQGARYYFGYSDPRFKYFFESAHSFHEICTYSFLGFGEFHKSSDGLWTNNKFAVPPQILDILLDATIEVRQEQFEAWRNIFTRDPQLVIEVSQLKEIYPYTKDGMYLYGSKVTTEFRKRLEALQGIRFFHSTKDKLNFEETLAKFDLPQTKVLRKLILDAVTMDYTYRECVFTWAALIFRIYGLDNLQTLLREKPRFFLGDSSNVSVESDQFGFLIEFLSGVPFKTFNSKIVHDATTGNVLGNQLFGPKPDVTRAWFRENFSLKESDKTRPYFWEFCRQHHISLLNAISLLSLGRPVGELLKPMNSEIPTLYKKGPIEIRAAFTALELYGWGKALKNCLFDYLSQATARTSRQYLFGIFEDGRLTGACRLGSSFKIQELRSGAPDHGYEKEKQAEFEKIVNAAIHKMGPIVKIFKAIRPEIEGLLALEVPKTITDADRKKEFYEGNIARATGAVNKMIEEMVRDKMLDGTKEANQELTPQVLRRALMSLTSDHIKVADDLLVLLGGSKPPPKKRGTPQQSHAQP